MPAQRFAKPLDVIARGHAEMQRKRRAAQFVQTARKLQHCAVALRNGRVPRSAVRAQSKTRCAFFRGLHRIDAFAENVRTKTAAFVDGIFRANQVRVFAHHPARAKMSARFFIRVRHKNNIARERHLIALELQQHGEFHRDQIFGVERAAPVQKSVANFAAERVCFPTRAFDRNHVEMRHQKQRRRAPIAAQTRHDVAAPRRRLQNLRVNVFTRQHARKIFARADFVAGRIDRVDAN